MKRAIRTAECTNHNHPKEEVIEFTALELVNAVVDKADLPVRRPLNVEWIVKTSDTGYVVKGVKVIIPLVKRPTTKRRR